MTTYDSVSFESEIFLFLMQRIGLRKIVRNKVTRYAQVYCVENSIHLGELPVLSRRVPTDRWQPNKGIWMADAVTK
jgi:hypothetical protein